MRVLVGRLGRHLFGCSVRCAALTVMLAAGTQVHAADQVFDARGFNPNRELVSELPFEHIDPMTGNVLLTFTDIELPGNAGFMLRVQRTYNSKIYSTYSNTGVYTLGEDSWAGLGWTLHFGRVTQCPQPATSCPPGPVIEMPDGSQHQTYLHKDGNIEHFMTRDFWTLDTTNRSAYVVRLLDGTKYTFARQVVFGATTYLYATKVEDAFGNSVTITYKTTPADGIDTVTQTVSPGGTRTIQFTTTPTIGGVNVDALSQMTVNLPGQTSRTWTYTPQRCIGSTCLSVFYSYLAEVQPPAGPKWQFDYYPEEYSDGWLLKKVTTPYGGTVTYTYQPTLFYVGSTVVYTPAVATRVTGGTDIVSGTWNYSYQSTSMQPIVTTVTGPTANGIGVTTKHTFDAVPTGSAAWNIGTLVKKEVTDTAGNRRTEELTWQASDAIGRYQEGPDPETHAPLLHIRKVTFAGSSVTYQTTYNYHSYTYSSTRAANFSDFGRPYQIVESGNLDRTTGRTPFYPSSSGDPSFQTLIVDRFSSETVTVGAESFTKSWDYDGTNGFKKSETIYGITTTFTPTSVGNVWKVTDAHSHVRTYQYAWGQVSREETPKYNPLLTREINADGTVKSEKRYRGADTFTTSFDYDALMRVRTVTPPVGNATDTTYDLLDGQRYILIARDRSETKTYVDGYGRPSRTINSRGVSTDTDYDARGRKRYQSLPYCDSGGLVGCTAGGTANVGDMFDYDGLDRVTKRTHTADNTDVAYQYSNGIDVTITNENNKTTSQNWSAFGSPEDARLMSITDADNKTWSYTYNGLGSLKTVTPPVGAARTWTYYGPSDSNGKPGLLKSETHPESGTVTYTYDTAGLVETRSDAEFGLSTLSYDSDDRLTYVDRPGTAYDTDLDWDSSNNRTLLANSYVSSTFTYDGANRPRSRTDATNGHTFVTTYTPDANDNLEQIDYPSGLQVKYGFDSENRINDVGTPTASGTWARSFVYHPSGVPSSFTAGNGIVHSETFTSRYWPDVISSGVVSLDYGYANDNVGNVKSIIDSVAGVTQSYTYDNVDRLLTANGQWGAASFSYDAAGNRRTKTVAGATTTYAISASTGRLDSATGAEAASYGYDANGNLKSVDSQQYTYTPENMIETVAGTTYRYDGDRMRTMKTEANGTTKHYYIHAPDGRLLSEFLQCGTDAPIPWRDDIYIGSRLLASVGRQTVTLAATSGGTAQIAEYAGSAQIPVVQVTTSDGQPVAAAVGVDYRTVSTGSATLGSGPPADVVDVVGHIDIPAGTATGAILTAAVPIVNDPDVERGPAGLGETFGVVLSNPSCGVVLGATTTTVTILDDDPIFSLSTDRSDVGEGNGNASVVITMRTAGGVPISAEAVVQYATADGDVDPKAGENITVNPSWRRDFTAVPNTAVRFSAWMHGDGTASATVSIPINDDGLDEDGESFTVRLSLPASGQLGTSVQRITIADNDAAPFVSVAGATVVEGDDPAATRPLQFAVSLTNAAGTLLESGRLVSVAFSTADGTAEADGNPVDYDKVQLDPVNRVQFAPGETGKTVVVTVHGDTVDEGSGACDCETMNLLLSAPSNAVLRAGYETAAGEIVDDDPPPQVAADSSSIEEGDEGTRTVGPKAWLIDANNRLVVAGKPVIVHYFTSDGTAVAGTPADRPPSDYVPVTAGDGVVTFAPGEQYHAMPVTVVGDGVHEDDETFSVTLCGDASPVEACRPYPPVNGTVGAASTSTVTIANDDPSVVAAELTQKMERLGRLSDQPIHYRVGQKAYASYEVVVDATSGAAGVGLRVVRRNGGGIIRQNGTAVTPALSLSRTLRWQNATDASISGEFITVANPTCNPCGTNDTYRIQLRETTYSIPRFNNSGQTTILIVQNTRSYAVTGRMFFWNPSGGLLATTQFQTTAHQTYVLDTSSVAALAGQSGSVTITHDGGYGDLSGKGVAVDGVNGVAFDTQMVPVQ